MWFLITLLWILVAGRVLSILLLPVLHDRTVTTTYTSGVIALRSALAMLSGVLLALAAIFLTQYAYGS
jgi:hypothetical protein